jgi:hypothetical protein
MNVAKTCETALLLRCCAVGKNRQWLDGKETLVDFNLDWRWVEHAARRHDIVPLVARYLMSVSLPSSAEQPLRNFRISFHANALRNLHLSHALTRILAAFHDLGIPVMPFKGPILSELMYGDPALRMFSDLDILIPDQFVARSAELLQSLGYRPETYNHEAFRSGFFHASEAAFITNEHSVDLHWRLSPGYYGFGPDGQDV